MRNLIFEALEHFNQNFVGKVFRNTGKRLYELGTKLEGQRLSEDRVTPSLRRLTYNGKQPILEDASFIAPNATILGDVSVGNHSSVWYGATLLGTSPIKIGKNTIIQDRVHISREVTIGNNVFVGPNSILQGSKLHNNSFVSMGATVRHATVYQGGFVAAGAVLFDNIEVKEGEIWAGNPGKFLRNITPLERQVLKEHLQEMHELAVIHSEETEKTTRDIANGMLYQQDSEANIDNFLADSKNSNFHYSEEDGQFIEIRLLMKDNIEFTEYGKDYEPYLFENKHLSEKFRVGIHEQQFANVGLKLKQKQQFEDKRPWQNQY